MLESRLKKFVLFTKAFLAISFTLIIFSLISVKIASAQAGINRAINFQGKLVNNPSATNVSNTSYTVVFTIYDDPDSGQGTALWTETQSVTTADGIFRVALGSVTPFPSNFNFNWSGLYLGIKVNADSEMTPRIQLAAVPYAFNSEKVAGLTVQDDGGNASTSGTLRVGNAKTVTFAGSRGLTFNDTASVTDITLPASGSITLVDTLTSQTLTNKIIGSTGLTFTGATTDITTGTNENLSISTNGTGLIGFNTSSPISSIDLRGNPVTGGTLSIASVSGKTSFATLVANNDGVGDLFTASASGWTRFVIKNDGSVGIGVNNPNNLIQVAGLINFDNSRDLTALGYQAGLNTTGGDNSFVGYQAGQNTSTGIDNSFFGSQAGRANTTGSDNAFLGYAAGADSSTGYNNSFFGSQAGSGNTFGTNNTFLGNLSGQTNTVGGLNTILGAGANLQAQHLINAGAIGANAYVAQHNSLVLGSIAGINSATESAKIGIGTIIPNAILDVKGGFGANALLTLNQLNNGDLITASLSGTTKFVVTSAGSISIAGGQAADIDTLTQTTLKIGTVYASSVTLGNSTSSEVSFNVGPSGNFIYKKNALAYQCSGTDKLTLNTSGQLICDTDQTGGGGVNWWNQLGGVLSPADTNFDFVIGGTSTASSKFSFTGVQTGQTIASVSGNLIVMPNNGWGGNLGIGVVNPSARFQVGGALGTPVVASVSGQLIIMANGGWGGSVGIGTITPTVELEVVGDIVSTGTKWTARTSAGDYNWNSVAYGNGMFVAVSSTAGTGNQVMTSPDGINWTMRTSAVDRSWRSITYGNGLFVAVANTGTGNRVMTSLDGISWTARTSAGDYSWNSVAYGNGMFVAVSSTAGTGNQVMTSPDGINWTMRTSATDATWFSVAYGNGTFVALAGNGAPTTAAMTSINGINWTSRTGQLGQWRSITYGNGQFVAVSTAGGIEISTNGASWALQSFPSPVGSPLSVTYGNGLFVITSIGSVLTSPDGVNWSLRTSGILSNGWNGVTYGNGIFVAVAYLSGTGNRVMTSGKNQLSDIPTNKYFLQGIDILGTNLGSGTLAVASMSGNTSFATLVVNNDGVGDIFTASASGWARFVVKNNGQLFAPFYNSAGCTLKADTSGSITCGTDLSAPNWWNQIGGAISPSDINYDFLLGANSTGSAKFSVTNMLTGTPLVSTTGNISAAGTTGLTLSGNNAGIAFSGTGISQITTAANQNLALNPGGNGLVGVNTDGQTVLASFDIRGNHGTIAVASVSGKTSYASLVANNDGVGDIFTASASGWTRFKIANNGKVTIGKDTDGLSFDPTSQVTQIYNGSARPTKTITLSPEYPGAVLTTFYGAGTDSSVTGNMTSDTDTTPGTSIRNYYDWTRTASTQNFYTVAVRISLPADFSEWTTSGAVVVNYRTGNATSTNSLVDVRIYNENSGTIVASSVNNANTSWSQVSIGASSLTGWATTGQTAVIYLRMGSQSSNYARVGDIQLNYLSKF